MGSVAFALLALLLASCAPGGGWRVDHATQTFRIAFGSVDLPIEPLGLFSRALPVDETRTIPLTLVPMIRTREHLLLPRSPDPAKRRGIAVVIVPSGDDEYLARVVWFPPSPPEFLVSGLLGKQPADPRVVEHGVHGGPYVLRGATTLTSAFTQGDPAGTWRVQAFVNGELHFETNFEVVAE